VTTGRDVLRFGRARTSAVTEPLVVADPDYDLCADEGAETREFGAYVPSPGCLSRAFPRDGTTFQRLQATEKEGQRIAATLATQRLWLRDAALDARIKAVRSPRMLHLATHGFFLADRPNVDQDSQSTSGFPSLRQEAGGAWSVAGIENPLLRSGLALAGVNTWLAARLVPADVEDGILTAEDVTGMDLTDTELVVLSACETGVGEVRSGEGIFGMRRAFVLAGARTLVMSLWKVPDSQTQELMEAFYRFLQSGTPPADALRQAKLSIREKHPEPYYWGSFICQGGLESIQTVPANVS
jgi:CHAT domain-containing protein